MLPAAATHKEQCLAFFRAGLAAADPQQAVANHLVYKDGRLHIRLAGNKGVRTGDWSRIHAVAFGKAACRMAQAAHAVIPPHLFNTPAIAVTNDENRGAVEGFEVVTASHPLPDANGLQAAGRVAALLSQATAGELVLLLISGGGSALLPYPAPGISLSDKTATTALLLNCGADISQINCVRKHLSQFKGGGMVRMAAPAEVHSLILSDVLGDDVSAIASGPSAADPTTFADAIAILRHYEVWSKTPAAVKAYLEEGAEGLHAETIKPTDAMLASADHTIIGSNAVSLQAVKFAAEQQGYDARIYHECLCGEARQVAEQWVIRCKTLLENDIPHPIAMVAGGETTVTVTGNGKGGRNQELALAFAVFAEQYQLPCQWTFFSAGTDGRDGPTDAAGGIVDRDTLQRIRQNGIDPGASLINNDAYNALKAADALVVTGATGTNVADLQILLLQPNRIQPH